ncbi:phage tail tape measure protein [Enterococcus dispar]|uniref:Phage tail tape measure protein, TP901 family, core region n=1 Tax=Enterococcus dispar ATCC 51266 TaxID=1139219 RepID=S0KCV6_9ENTE|nr:phage tail tape measure protein [Enterococcus dispar]EOT42744.1 phage tail tape measure protein, TP901 family, core region [Enterococcus dispar ATCC 51266]EOW84805.1 phage tail tape measure protein, TP901 family, core region [Enterococcus dispar ATCC 51266]OJG38450.1 phage tail tape measure protein, TP901 family, core region [Enterococcus dispar]
MAQEFVGLTVKFGANTVEFDNSVKGINSALSLLKKDLQSINQQLKLDPNNVDLINRKMQNFQQQMDLGRKKVEELRKEQAALGDEKIGTAEWQKLESEIQKTEAQMQVVQRAIDNTQSKLKALTPGNIEYVNRQLDVMSDKLDKAAAKVGKVKDGFEKAGNAAAPFSAAAAGGLIAGAKAAGDLQEQVSKTKAVFKDNAGEMDKFAEASIDNINMSENTARTLMNTYGGMGAGLGVAKKDNAEFAKQITSMTADMSAFNDVSTERAQTALKGIYTGESESLKEMSIVMTQNVLDQYALSKGYGKSTKEMSEAEKVALRYNYVMEKMGEQGALGAAKREQDSFNGQLRLFKEQILEIAKNIGNVLMPALEPFLKKLNTFTEKLRKLSPEELEKVVKGMVVLAAVAPTLLGVAKILGVVQGALGAMSKAMLFLKDTKFAGLIAKAFGGISGGVILGIVAAIVAVVVALKQLWDRSEGFRKAMTDIWNNIKENVMNAINNITGGKGFAGIQAAWQKVWAYIEPAWLLFQEIVGVAAVVIGSAVESITKIFEGLSNIIAGAFSGNSEQVKKGFDQIVQAIVGFKDRVFSYISGIDWGSLAKTAITKVVAGLKTLGSFLWDAFKVLFNTAINFIKTIDWGAVGSWVLRTITTGLKALGSFLWNTVQTLFKTAMNLIKSIDWYNVGSTLIKLIINAISAIGGMVWNVLKSIFTTAKNNSTGSIDWASIGSKIIRMIGQAISTIGGAIWNALRGAFDTAVSKAKNVDWGSVGRSIVNGIVSGITGLGDAIYDKISSAFNSAKSWVADKWNALKNQGSFSFSGKVVNSKGQSIMMAAPQMALVAASPASAGTNLSITVNTKGSGAKEIANEVEKIIVRRIQS